MPGSQNVTLTGRGSSKRGLSWGTWVAQLVKRPTLEFGSGPDLRVVSSSLTLGSVLGVEPAWGSLLSLPRSPPPPLLSLSLSLKNPNKTKQNKNTEAIKLNEVLWKVLVQRDWCP